MVGYVIFEINNEGDCKICDLLAINSSVFRPMMAAFLKKMLMRDGVKKIRIKLNKDHLYRKQLRLLGFIKKMEKEVFQVYDPRNIGLTQGLKWCVGVIDKDT